MAGPKVGKDSIFDSDEINKQIQVIIEGLKLVVANGNAAAEALKNTAAGLKGEGPEDLKKLAVLASDLGKISKSNAQAEIALEQVKQQKLKTLAAEQAAQSKATAEAEKATKTSLKFTEQAEKENGTLGRLALINKQLTIERTKLNLSTEEGRARLIAINKELDDNNLFIKNNSDSLTKQRLNVGNYTESIKTALQQSGLFGESIERITSISEKAAVVYELLHGAVHKLTDVLGLHKEATEANTAATEINTSIVAQQSAVTELNVAATELNSAASEGNTIAIETATVAAVEHTTALAAETIATEAAEIATGRLSKALNFISKNPALLIIAGLAAVVAAVEAVITSTQEGSDAQDELKEATEAGAKAAVTFGAETRGYTVDVEKATLAAKERARAEHELRDEGDANLITFALLAKQAADARLDAEKENTTTQEKIDLLERVLETRRKLAEVQKEEATKEFALTLGLTNSTEDLAKATDVLNKAEQGVAITRQSLSKNFFLSVSEEQVKKADEAAKKIIDIDTELAQGARRIQTRQTSLLDQDRKERLAMLQTAQKEEVESIRITSEKRSIIISETRDKELKLEDQRFKTEQQNLKEQQRKLGLIDDPELKVKQQQDFNKENEATQKIHLTNLFNINKKASEEARQELKRQAEQEEALNFAIQKAKNDVIPLDPNNPSDVSRAVANNELLKAEAKSKAESDHIQRVAERIDRIESQNLLIVQLLAIDQKFAESEYQIYAEAAKKRDDLTNKGVDDFKKGQDDKLKALELSLNEQGKLQEDIEKELSKQRIESLNEEIKKRHDAGLTALDQELALLAERKAAEKRVSKEIVDEAQKVTEVLSDILEKRNERTNEALDYEVKTRERAINTQQERANRGLKNQLSFEQAGLDKAELAKKEAAEKQRKQEEALKLASIFETNLQQKLSKGDDFGKASLEALGETLETRAIATVIAGAFAEGVENFKGKGDGKSDSNLILFSNGESVVTAKATAEHPGLVTALNKGLFDDQYLPKYAIESRISTSFAENVTNSILVQQLTTMNKKMDYLEAIARKPDTTVHLDNLGNVIRETVEHGVKQRTKIVSKQTWI